MIIKDCIPFEYDIPASSALSHCAMFATRRWGQIDSQILKLSFELFIEWEKKNPIPFWKNRRFNLYVLYEPEASVSLPNKIIGTTATLIFLRMDKIIPLYPHPICFAIVLEEFCHAYYMIADEFQVKELVIQILHAEFPFVGLHDLYPRLFDHQGKRYPLP